MSWLTPGLAKLSQEAKKRQSEVALLDGGDSLVDILSFQCLGKLLRKRSVASIQVGTATLLGRIGEGLAWPALHSSGPECEDGEK
jgi:hypothetical protein